LGQGVGHPGEVVFDPLGVSRGGVGVEAEKLAFDVDPALAVALELFADGAVVEVGIDRGHLGADMAQEALNDVLRDPLVDEPGSQGVAKLMQCDADGTSGFVVEANVGLPVGEDTVERAVAQGQARVPAGGEQPG
jgi:hypothetical protein